jgi:DNA-binding response OmpR family regulator
MPNKHCLLVDDEKFITDVLESCLSIRGYHPVSVQSGKAALKALERFIPSFIILDINLIDMSGFDFLRAIRKNQKYAETLVFMLTGRREIEAQLVAFDLGATEFFNKTSNFRDIVEQIQDVLWARSPGLESSLATNHF